LGVPSLSDISLESIKEIMASDEKEAEVAVDQTGEQQVNIIAQGFEYLANGPTVFKAGVPTELSVDNKGVLGCGSFIASRGLFNGFVSLKMGANTIDLGSPKKGSYKLTCSMGMVPPLTIKFQ